MAAEGQSIKVLIADDDPIVRAVLEGLVGRADDLELVGAADDATEATELAGRHQPHVAVLDWVMPDGGGPQAAKDIARVSPETKVIALTASDSGHAEMDMLRAGAINVLVKDASMPEIAEAIRAAARGG
jgi:DNA-binding NarL/FixJ family response regulator